MGTSYIFNKVEPGNGSLDRQIRWHATFLRAHLKPVIYNLQTQDLEKLQQYAGFVQRLMYCLSGNVKHCEAILI